MKTIAQLEALEQMHHETGLTGQALLDKYDATYHSSALEPPLYDNQGGPVHDYFMRKLQKR